MIHTLKMYTLRLSSRPPLCGLTKDSIRVNCYFGLATIEMKDVSLSNTYKPVPEISTSQCRGSKELFAGVDRLSAQYWKGRVVRECAPLECLTST